jgi:hypothetical protein
MPILENQTSDIPTRYHPDWSSSSKPLVEPHTVGGPHIPPWPLPPSDAACAALDSAMAAHLSELGATELTLPAAALVESAHALEWAEVIDALDRATALLRWRESLIRKLETMT